jgi:hypothetical protein
VIHYVLHEVPVEDRPSTVKELGSKVKPGGFIHLREPTKNGGHGMPIEEVGSLMDDAGLTESLKVEKKGNFQIRYTKGG